MSDLVGNPEDRFSHVAAQLLDSKIFVLRFKCIVMLLFCFLFFFLLLLFLFFDLFTLMQT